MANEIQGSVVRVNSQGDLVSDIPCAAVSPLVGLPDVRVELDEHFTVGIFPRDHGEPESTLIAVLGEQGFLEIGIVGMNACEMLGIRVGQPIRIRWGSH